MPVSAPVGLERMQASDANSTAAEYRRYGDGETSLLIPR
jgi:hypothetical protein